MPSELEDLIAQLTNAVNGIKDPAQRKAVVNAINKLKQYLGKTYSLIYPTSGWVPPKS